MMATSTPHPVIMGAPLKFDTTRFREGEWVGEIKWRTGGITRIRVYLMPNSVRTLVLSRHSTKTDGSVSENVNVHFNHAGDLEGVQGGRLAPEHTPGYIDRTVEEESIKEFLRHPKVIEWLDRELAPHVG